jgi:hypothetical protein
VCELERAGKPNAWNEFVHRLADQSADYIIMIDADVWLNHPDTLWSLVDTLEKSPGAFFSVGRVLKDVALKEKKSFWERMSLAGSELRHGSAAQPGITGCLYCGRGEVMRRIWFAEGMIGEDAFLNGIVTTDFLRSATPKPELIVAAPNASVVFEAYMRLGEFWANQRRRAVTRGVNAILYSYLWANVNEKEDAVAVIKRRNEEDPQWFVKLLGEKIEEKGWWVLPEGVVTLRLKQLKGLPLWKAAVKLPVALAGFGLDLCTHLAANRRLRKKRLAGIWKDKSPAGARGAMG